MPIHPKTSAAALGGALGLLIVAVLGSIHGVSLSAEANAAIPAFLSALGSWLSPSPDTPAAPAVDDAIAQAKRELQASFNATVAALPQPDKGFSLADPAQALAAQAAASAQGVSDTPQPAAPPPAAA